MNFSEFSDIALPKIEIKINNILTTARIDQDESLYRMLSSHLGLANNGSIPTSRGKRIRPLLLLLTNVASGGNWENAIPAAVAIELIHNFSLIHDDIEDQSEQRRGRPTLWKTHGLPLSINAGDALFSLSFICLGDLQQSSSEKMSFQAFHLLSQACLSLTKGQHLDISFEDLETVPISEYLKMIEGKTATLLAVSSQMGALIAEKDQSVQELYYQFGKNIGLAFQIYDDILGIWGDPRVTGKSTSTDLVTRKKTLPILYGLSRNDTFRDMWEKEISPDNITKLAFQLREEGAYDFAMDKATEFTSTARNALYQAEPKGYAVEAIEDLISSLTKRKS